MEQGDDRCRSVGRAGHHQAARGLRVHQHVLPPLLHIAGHGDVVAETLPVPVGRARVVALFGVVQGARQDRQLVPIQRGGEICPLAHLEEMAAQPEAGDVGDAVHVVHLRQICADGIELRRAFQHLPVAVGVEFVLVHRRAEDADAEPLAQDQHVAVPGVGIALDPVGRHEADHREPIDGFGRIDGVAAADRHARIGAGAGAARENLLDLVLRHLVDGEPGDGQRHDRLAADGVDIGQRVGRRDPAVIERVVDDGHEEIGGRDHALFLVDLVNSRVVPGLEADEERRVRRGGR